MAGQDTPGSTPPSGQIIGEDMVKYVDYYPPLTNNTWDNPEDYCPVCGAYKFSCFTLPGIGGPHATP